MKTTYIVLIGLAVAGGVGIYAYTRKTATATPKPTLLGALGGFLSSVSEATRSTTTKTTTGTTAARADAVGLDLSSSYGNEYA